MRTAWMVLLLVPLAGCLSDEAATQDEPTNDPASTPADPVLHFNSTADVALTQVRTPFVSTSLTNLQSNCLRLPRADMERVVGGNITATWDEALPLGLELRMAGEESALVAGSSPLTLEVGEMAPRPEPDFADGYMVMVQAATNPGAASVPQVTLQFNLLYEGDETVSIEDNWSCTHG